MQVFIVSCLSRSRLEIVTVFFVTKWLNDWLPCKPTLWLNDTLPSWIVYSLSDLYWSTIKRQHKWLTRCMSTFQLPYVSVSSKCLISKQFRTCPVEWSNVVFGNQSSCGCFQCLCNELKHFLYIATFRQIILHKCVIVCFFPDFCWQKIGFAFWKFPNQEKFQDDSNYEVEDKLGLVHYNLITMLWY